MATNEAKLSAEEQLALEERKLALEAQKLKNQLLIEELAQLKTKAAAKAQKREDQEKQETQKRKDLAYRQATCNHKKGGFGTEAIVGGQGDRDDHAIAMMVSNIDNSFYAECTRCHKVWFSDSPDAHEVIELVKANRTTNKPMFTNAIFKTPKQFPAPSAN